MAAFDPEFLHLNPPPEVQAIQAQSEEDGRIPTISVKRGLHWVDYLLFALLLLSSLAIGVYHAITGKKTTKEYLMGGRNLKVIPTALSIFMSFVSAILVLGNTAEMYTWGSQAFLSIFGDSLAYLFVAVVFVPLFYPLNLTSSFEYLEKRYKTKIVKIVGTVLLLISQILYMGIAMFAPATALAAVTDVPVWGSILASGAVATIYTTIGGMKAVIWTDVVQGVVYLAGIIVVLALGSARVGGMSEVWRIAYEGGRINFWNPNPNPAGDRVTLFAIIIGRFVASLQTLGTAQTSVQRYCALPNMKKARISVLLNLPAIIIMYVLTCLLGLVVYSYYAMIKCDPLRAGLINNANQLLPAFVLEVAGYPGIPGIFLAVLFSGALSTLSSSLSALSAVTWKMIEWNRHVRENVSESSKSVITKLLALLFGLLGIGMAFLAERLGEHVLQASSSFVSGVAGPLLGMYVLGGLFPWANWIGASIGAVIGLAFSMWIAIGSYVTRPYSSSLNTTTENCWIYPNTTDTTPWMQETTTYSTMTTTEPPGDDPLLPLYKMSYLWFPSIGMGTTVVLGLIISLITGPMKVSEIEPGLMIPFIDRLFCYMPLSCRRLFWCGVDHEQSQEPDNKVHPQSTQDETMEMKVENGSLKQTEGVSKHSPPPPYTEGEVSESAVRRRESTAALPATDGIQNKAFDLKAT